MRIFLERAGTPFTALKTVPARLSTVSRSKTLFHQQNFALLLKLHFAVSPVSRRQQMPPLTPIFLDFIYSPAKCGYACVSGKSVCRSNTILPPNALRRPPNSISVRRGNFHSSNIVSGKRTRLSRRKSVLSAHIVADGKGEVSLIERCTSLNYAFSPINYLARPTPANQQPHRRAVRYVVLIGGGAVGFNPPLRRKASGVLTPLYK